LNQPRHCPAVLIAAPASGQGKTTVTAALARLHRNLGRKVRVFKCGPDFLDPMIHERASGAPVYQLDMWMVGEQESRRLLWEAAGEADLILIEGVMGLFDGTPSSADLARHFGVPVLAVIDGTAMAQTFGALALGLARYQADLPFAGVLANRVGTVRHAQLLEGSLTEGLRWYGALSRETGIELPSRHLGLVQASELNDLDLRLDAAAAALASSCEVALPPPVEFAAPEVIEAQPLLAGVRIAVARDEAFAFTYGASLDLLRAMGAQLHFFSPIHDRVLPDADSLYLPGGYPELHHQALSQNTAMLQAIRAHHSAGKPLLAECGGMLYLLDSLTDVEGTRAELLGLLAGRCDHAETPGGPGPANRRIAGRRIARPHLSSFADQHAVAAHCPWPEPQWRARRRSGVSPRADDGLLCALLFPVQPGCSGRAVCAGWDAANAVRLHCNGRRGLARDRVMTDNEAERDAIYRAIAERRDMRHFSGGTVAPELLHAPAASRASGPQRRPDAAVALYPHQRPQPAWADPAAWWRAERIRTAKPWASARTTL
jgi:cobyrinic acid a,c-diamide synthase